MVQLSRQDSVSFYLPGTLVDSAVDFSIRITVALITITRARTSRLA